MLTILFKRVCHPMGAKHQSLPYGALSDKFPRISSWSPFVAPFRLALRPNAVNRSSSFLRCLVVPSSSSSLTSRRPFPGRWHVFLRCPSRTAGLLHGNRPCPWSDRGHSVPGRRSSAEANLDGCGACVCCVFLWRCHFDFTVLR